MQTATVTSIETTEVRRAVRRMLRTKARIPVNKQALAAVVQEHSVVGVDVSVKKEFMKVMFNIADVGLWF